MPFILGLTGSIAMGKSTASGFFSAFSIPVFDADAAVHALFLPGGAAVRPVLSTFPGCGSETIGVDRKALGQAVFDDADALQRLEQIVHPLVRATQRRFLVTQAAAGRPLAVMDIPLLYETGGDKLMDAVAVVSAPAFIQAQRVLRRPGMTRERLDAILQRQMPDLEKRQRADFVIPTGLGKRCSIKAIAGIIDEVKNRRATAWAQRWMAQRRVAQRRVAK